MKTTTIKIKNSLFNNGFNIINEQEAVFLSTRKEVLKYIENQKKCDYCDIKILDETKTFNEV